MTKTNGEQVADLIKQAFSEAANEVVTSPHGPPPPTSVTLLRIHAAQAIATLELARETKIQNLILLAGLESVAGTAPNPEIAQEAYTAAVMALGLAEDPEDGMTSEQFADLFADDDPADADLGDLK